MPLIRRQESLGLTIILQNQLYSSRRKYQVGGNDLKLTLKTPECIKNLKTPECIKNPPVGGSELKDT